VKSAPERNRAVKGVLPGPQDAAVLYALEDLPCGADRAGQASYRSVVLNAFGQAYRIVDHKDVVEFVYFSARMNALGFKRTATRREGPFGRYDAVFSLLSPGPAVHLAGVSGSQ
jgi:hypothetical protein